MEHLPGWTQGHMSILGYFQECWVGGPGKQGLGCSVGAQGQAGDRGHIEVHMPLSACRWDSKASKPAKGARAPWPPGCPQATCHPLTQQARCSSGVIPCLSLHRPCRLPAPPSPAHGILLLLTHSMWVPPAPQGGQTLRLRTPPLWAGWRRRGLKAVVWTQSASVTWPAGQKSRA